MPTTLRNPFPAIPTTYISDDFDPGRWPDIAARFDELEGRPVRSTRELKRWLSDYSELASALAQEEAKRYIAMTCRTDDPETEAAYLAYQRDILPQAKPRWQSLKERYLSFPARTSLPAAYAVFDRSVKNDIAIFREANVPLETREAEVAQQYQKIMGAMTVRYAGQERTLQQMGRYLEVQEASTRKEAWELIARRYLQDRDAIDAIYDELVALRDRMARQADFASFRDYAFRMRGRFDYGPKECYAYHAAVEAAVVPALQKLHERRRRMLRQETLRPWDLNVDPRGQEPLRPFEKADQLFKGVRDIYKRISPDLARIFEAIGKRKLLDLESRKGKAPGGYQYTLDVDRVPFIFMNAAGLHRDVETLLHEGGHAFHAVFSRKFPLVEYRHSPLEFAEVASQGMEIIGLDHLDVFYRKESEVRQARRKHFEDAIALLAWVAQIDSFQHWVYTDPKHSREDRRRAWLERRAKYKGDVAWEGYEDAHASLWHRQGHLFGSPFYYIEYAISLLGALQLWQNARKDRKKAIARYRKALALGGSRPLPELFAAAGLAFDFSERMVAPIVRAVMKELDELD